MTSRNYQDQDGDGIASGALVMRRAQGERIYREVMQTDPPGRASVLSANCALDQQFAEVWSRGVLTRKERRWITLAACAAQAAPNVLRRHVYGALKSDDITVDEMMEGIYHFALYRGTPRAEEWEQAMWDVADEIGLAATDAVDLTPRTWDSEEDRIATGTDTFESVMGFAPPPPDMDVYAREGVLKSVFAELWTRGVLTQKERRLITLVGVCTSALNIPIASHVRSAMETGDLTIEETQEFMFHLAFYAGWPTVSECNMTMHAGWHAINDPVAEPT